MRLHHALTTISVAVASVALVLCALISAERSRTDEAAEQRRALEAQVHSLEHPNEAPDGKPEHGSQRAHPSSKAAARAENTSEALQRKRRTHEATT